MRQPWRKAQLPGCIPPGGAMALLTGCTPHYHSMWLTGHAGTPARAGSRRAEGAGNWA